MKFKFSLLVFIFLLNVNTAQTQSNEEQIIAVIQQLFDGMRANDSMMIKDLFAPESTLSSIFTNREGQVVKRSSPTTGFVTAVGRPHDEVWDEKIWSYEIKIDDPMGQAWTEYTFYVGDRLSHCGVNVFEMIHLQDGWKISGITDTRRNHGCKSKANAEVNEFIDHWHLAAALADEDTFFGSMTPDGIYIGTDASERWERDEMKEWSKKYFERESAWTFTPTSRNIRFSEDEKIGWFDEMLDTWMGPCRGSGVVIMTEDGWKIQHYHLAIAVPNEQVDGYLELIGKPRK